MPRKATARKTPKPTPEAPQTAKKGIGHVIGVYSHAKDGWRVVFVKDGVRKQRSRKTEAAAQELAANLALELEGPARLGVVEQPALPDGKGLERGEWSRVLWDLTAKVLKNPGSDSLTSALRAISNAANAAAKFIDDAELKARLSQAERDIERIKHGRSGGQVGDASSKQSGPATTPTELL